MARLPVPARPTESGHVRALVTRPTVGADAGLTNLAGRSLFFAGRVGTLRGGSGSVPVFPRLGRGGFGDAHEPRVVLDAGPVEERAAGDGQIGIIVLVGVDEGSGEKDVNVITMHIA